MVNDHSDHAHGYLLGFPLTGSEFLFRSPFYSNLFFLNSLFVVSMQFTCGVSISVSQKPCLKKKKKDPLNSLAKQGARSISVFISEVGTR